MQWLSGEKGMDLPTPIFIGCTNENGCWVNRSSNLSCNFYLLTSISHSQSDHLRSGIGSTLESRVGDMGVAFGGAAGGVPKGLGNHIERVACLHEPGGVAVAQIVHTNIRYPLIRPRA